MEYTVNEILEMECGVEDMDALLRDGFEEFVENEVEQFVGQGFDADDFGTWRKLLTDMPREALAELVVMGLERELDMDIEDCEPMLTILARMLKTAEAQYMVKKVIDHAYKMLGDIEEAILQQRSHAYAASLQEHTRELEDIVKKLGSQAYPPAPALVSYLEEQFDV